MSATQEWFVHVGHQLHGPIASQQLRELAAAGKIKPDDRIRQGRNGPWMNAGQINGLFTSPQAALPSPPPVAVPVVPQAVAVPPIACPYCFKPMDFAADLVGSQVACAHCGQQFTMPLAGHPAVPMVYDTQGTMPTIRAGWRQRNPTPLEAFFCLFDFRFEHYLTPWIIRVSWVLFLLLALLNFGGAILHAVGARLGDAPAIGRDGLRDARAVTEPLIDADVSRRLLRAAIWSVVTVLGLLYLRVLCESVIVIFNIAASLKAIEQYTRKP